MVMGGFGAMQHAGADHDSHEHEGDSNDSHSDNEWQSEQQQVECGSKHFYCEEHSQVTPFTLKEIRTQVFDTYAICAALLTGLSASRFFFDNRQHKEFLTGHGFDRTIHLSFLFQHVHILLAAVCTAAGLESMLVFVLCAMYSRSALALPKVGSKVFEYFLGQTGMQRANAFKFMLGSGVLSSFNVIINCLTMPTFVVRAEVPAIILDFMAVSCAIVSLIIVLITLREVGAILDAASIIFVPQEKLDEFIGEKAHLIKHEDPPAKPRSPKSRSRTVSFEKSPKPMKAEAPNPLADAVLQQAGLEV